MKYSIVIPAKDEEGGIAGTLETFISVLEREELDYEMVVVNDNSQDKTAEILDALAKENPRICPVHRQAPSGFGRAIRDGLSASTGEAIAIVMADASDDPEDVVKYYRKLEEGYDCVFGSRFIKGSKVIDYPAHKLLLNRLGNKMLQLFFMLGINDLTNAFKAYRRHVIEACHPIMSVNFNITIELPLKAINRGFTYTQVPINWYNRTTGKSSFKIKELGSKYIYTMLMLWLEYHLIRDEYDKTGPKYRPPKWIKGKKQKP